MSRFIYHKLFWNTILIANLYAIGHVWLVGSADLLRFGDGAHSMIAFGRLTGLLLEAAILVELILVSRFPAIERVYGFDKQNTLHRGLGYSILAFLLAHPILLSLGYGLQMDRGAWEQFMSFVLNWEDVFAACIAVGIMVAVGILSLPVVRRFLAYEVWYFLHLPMYVAVALAFNHQIVFGDVSYGGAMHYWLGLNIAVFGLVLMYRFLVPIYQNLKHQFRVVRVVRESPSVVSVYITGRHLEDFRFEAGQWARSMFFQRGMWYVHPFSFSAPYDGKELRFSIKSLGDWTNRAGDLAPGTRVWIEGPLGALTLSHAASTSYLFIAGGIGITPILAMLRTLAHGADAALLYAARTRQDLLFEREITATGIRSQLLLSSEVCSGYESGAVSLERIRATCPDFLTRDVYLCGPPAMLRTLSGSLVAAGLPREQLHVERFGL